MTTVKAKKDPSGVTWEYELTDEKGNSFLTGDGFESLEEVFTWLVELRDNLTNALFNFGIDKQ